MQKVRPKVPGQTVHVLLVEDDEIDAEIVKRSFNSLTISNPITIAQDGLEALNILRGEEGYERLLWPYLILLDIKMPRMDGLEFLQAIRQDDELKPSIVFILTTSDSEVDKEAAYANHVAGYFLKQRSGDAILDLPTLMKNYCQLVEFPPKR